MSGQRQKQLINRKVQVAIVVRVLVHLVAYNAAVMSVLIVAWGLQNSVNVLKEGQEPLGAAAFREQIWMVIAAMAVMLPVMTWDLIRLTNKVAGPLHRFQSILDEFVRSGKLQKASLRERDLLTEFQGKFNEFAEALHALHPETNPDRTLDRPLTAYDSQSTARSFSDDASSELANQKKIQTSKVV